MTDTLARLTTVLADRYRIERELGAGGMATVYLAHDLRHGRDVAIKVLHPDLGAALGGERFLSEIRTTARLQHPHILPLLDSGAAEGMLFYVMPLATGETLRTRLSRERQLSLEDALRIAREVADALGHAHALGVIHRDIKPENILIQGGHALVADFGIALAVQTAGAERMTQTGLSLGTPQYMSPEQAMGERTIDSRSDIYSLGAVTYEMLAGDPPFTGSSVQAIVAKVLTEKPTPLRTLRDTVPPGVEHAVLTALAKVPADRFASAADFSNALTAERFASIATTAAVQHGNTRALTRARRATVALAVVAAVAIVVALWERLHATPASDLGVHRLEFTSTGDVRFSFPVGGILSTMALSPDGRRVVISAARPGGWSLAIRDVDRLAARLIPGTDGALYPEFSPDGRWIAFEAPDGTIKKVAVNGGAMTTVCKVGSGGTLGLTWLTNSEIVYSPAALISGMYRVSADGGTPQRFTPLDSAAGERFQLEPRAADDGRLIFFSSTNTSVGDQVIGVATARDGKTKRLSGLSASRPLGLVGDLLVYVRADGALMVAPFDRRTLTAGTPIQVGDSIATRNYDAAASLSASGTLLYQVGGAAGQLVRVDPTGRESILIDSVRPYLHPRFSPNGRHLAFEVTGVGSADIWTSDLVSKTLERVTNGGVNDRPEWSPDGKRIMYLSSRETPIALWWQPVDGSAEATKLASARDPIREAMFTPDGRALVYRSDATSTNRDIWMVPVGGERTPIPLLASASNEKQPRVSPDSKWLAYMSNESGRDEVYVRQLAAGSGRVQVSAGGGGEPLWAPDGRRLFYRAADKLMEATLTSAPGLAVTGRRIVFDGPYATDMWHPNYDVAPDGQSFVMVRPVGESRRLVLVLNWTRELQALRNAK